MRGNERNLYEKGGERQKNEKDYGAWIYKRRNKMKNKTKRWNGRKEKRERKKEER